MARLEIVDVTDEERFGLIPPCADPAFDHRTCDYWEDARSGFEGAPAQAGFWPARGGGRRIRPAIRRRPVEPVRPAAEERGRTRSCPPRSRRPTRSLQPRPAPSPIHSSTTGGDPPAGNPFAPGPRIRPTIAAEAPRKLQLLGRGLGVFGSYAKLLLIDGVAGAYCQFGPLSAYPRALRLRELYTELPTRRSPP